jgi:general L-amino acid transport system substrate-binding protein
MALVQAEEFGISSKNIDQFMKSKNPGIQRFLGTDPDAGLGKALGLDNDWVVRVIKKVGNYGEIFERNVGPKTSLGLERGLNALWTEGGLQYAAPFR